MYIPAPIFICTSFVCIHRSLIPAVLAQLLMQFQKQVSVSSIRLANATTTTADIVNARSRAVRSIDTAVNKLWFLLSLAADVGGGGKCTDVWTLHYKYMHYIISSHTLY